MLTFAEISSQPCWPSLLRSLLRSFLILYERLSFAERKVNCGKEIGHIQSVVGHLTKYLVSHLKVCHVKNPLFS